MSDPLFRAWNFFLVRTPLAVAWDEPSTPLHHHGEPDGGVDAYLTLLKAAGKDPMLVEAVALATPTLTALMDKVASGQGEALSGPRLRRAALAMLRYDIRMRTRPTPFGLFAGVCGGEFDSSAKSVWGVRHRTRTHVDMGWLLTTVHSLESDSLLLPTIKVQAHQALLTRGDRIALDIPSTRGAAPGETDRASISVRNSAVVAQVVQATRSPVLMGDLAGHLLTEFPDASAEQVERLLRVLVEQEILLTELRPPLDGTDPLDHVIRVLRRSAAKCHV